MSQRAQQCKYHKTAPISYVGCDIAVGIANSTSVCYCGAFSQAKTEDNAACIWNL